MMLLEQMQTLSVLCSDSQCPTPQQPPAAISTNCTEAPEQPLDLSKGFLDPLAGSGWRPLSPSTPAACMSGPGAEKARHARYLLTVEAFAYKFLVLSKHWADFNFSTLLKLTKSGQTLSSKAKGSP